MRVDTVRRNKNLASAIGAILSAGAAAAVAPSAAIAQGAESTSLQEVIVTASRREEAISDIPASDGRRIQIGWFQTETKGMSFNQSMTIPSELKLTATPGGPRMTFTPVRELAALRATSHRFDDVTLGPGERASVPTGVAVALPDGYAAFVHPRSGLARRHGVTVVNAPGTVDAGYRGEIRVALLNTDAREAYRIEAGDRIAQLVVMPVSRARFVEVEKLPGSLRGEGGFGSTGFGANQSGAHA